MLQGRGAEGANLRKGQTGLRAADVEAVIGDADAGLDPESERLLRTIPAVTDPWPRLRDKEGVCPGELGDFVSQSGQVADETQDKEGLARIAYFEAIRIVKNHHDAQDIAGEAMVRFLAAPVLPKTPGAWIRTVAHNVALDHVERGRRFQQVAPLLVDRDQCSVTEETQSVGTEVLGEAMALLPARQSEAVRLFYFEKLDRAGVAQRMGVSLNTVKTHLERALVALKAYFDEADQRGDQ
jgi:RNA polymerase sigma-70 factor (ECF subfamily)